MTENKRILEFIADGQHLEKSPNCDFKGIVKDTKGYLRAKFYFKNGYCNCGKMAIFKKGYEEFPVKLKDNECDIPEQALSGDTFEVYVIGVMQGYRIRTNEVKVMQYG